MGLKFDAILTSPLARAAETAEIVSAAYENTPPPQVLPALATGVAPPTRWPRCAHLQSMAR